MELETIILLWQITENIMTFSHKPVKAIRPPLLPLECGGPQTAPPFEWQHRHATGLPAEAFDVDALQLRQTWTNHRHCFLPGQRLCCFHTWKISSWRGMIKWRWQGRRRGIFWDELAWFLTAHEEPGGLFLSAEMGQSRVVADVSKCPLWGSTAAICILKGIERVLPKCFFHQVLELGWPAIKPFPLALSYNASTPGGGVLNQLSNPRSWHGLHTRARRGQSSWEHPRHLGSAERWSRFRRRNPGPLNAWQHTLAGGVTSCD